MSQVTITPIAGHIGAEVTGLDVKTMSPSESELLEQAFLDHAVLAIRDQSLDAASLLEFTERLGGVGETPYLEGLPDFPDVVPVVKEAQENSQHTFGAGWHTDFSFQRVPPSRTLLYAVDVPPVGGDTLYCRLDAAYEMLSSGLQATLSGMNCLHSAVRSYGPKATLKDHMENMTITNDDREPEEHGHPVICRHPDTGKPVLWVNPTYSIRFQDMTEAESEPLLGYLNQLAVTPSLTCRVTWKPGTLTLWDNRCTQHCATTDYRGHRREMLRTTVAGTAPVACEVTA